MDFGAWDLGAALARALTYGATLSVAGLGLFPFYATPPQPVARELGGPILGLAVLAALLTLLKFPLLAGQMGGLPAAFDLTMLERMTLSREGCGAVLRLGGLLLLGAGLRAGAARAPLQVSGALLAATSFAVTGHVHARHSSALSGLLAVHLVGAAIWLGALWPLARVLDHYPAQATLLVQRFSRVALLSVPVLLIAGLLLLTQLLGSVSALWMSSYGRWLCAKLLLVCALLGLAAVNRWRLTPRLGAPGGIRSLRRSIHVEMALAAGVLAVTACLTTLTGPDG